MRQIVSKIRSRLVTITPDKLARVKWYLDWDEDVWALFRAFHAQDRGRGPTGSEWRGQASPLKYQIFGSWLRGFTSKELERVEYSALMCGRPRMTSCKFTRHWSWSCRSSDWPEVLLWQCLVPPRYSPWYCCWIEDAHFMPCFGQFWVGDYLNHT